jgi:hypothetical protein
LAFCAWTANSKKPRHELLMAASFGSRTTGQTVPPLYVEREEEEYSLAMHPLQVAHCNMNLR